MTIIELLTTLAILGFVLSGVIAVYVGGLHAEVDMNERFQAQQNARLALTTIRKDIRSACSASVASGGVSVTLGEGCSSGVSSSSVTWCASSASGSAPYTMYRQTGATCAYNNGTSEVGSLKTNAVFVAVTTSGQHPQLQVTFPVDANLSNSNAVYTLGDTIELRNAAVTP